MSSEKIFIDPIFRFSWMVITGGKLNHALEQFSRSIGEDPWTRGPFDPDAHFAAHQDHKCGLFWFKDKEPSAGLVAHEAFHGAMFALSKLEVEEVTLKNEEIMAHYLNYLVDELSGKVWKRKK